MLANLTSCFLWIHTSTPGQDMESVAYKCKILYSNNKNCTNLTKSCKTEHSRTF